MAESAEGFLGWPSGSTPVNEPVTRRKLGNPAIRSQAERASVSETAPKKPSVTCRSEALKSRTRGGGSGRKRNPSTCIGNAMNQLGATLRV